MKAGGLALQNLIQPTISLEMPVPSQGHYGFHNFLVVDCCITHDTITSVHHLTTHISLVICQVHKGNNKITEPEQSYKGKVKTHKYINRQNQSTTRKL
jgi:hypothetical protein